MLAPALARGAPETRVVVERLAPPPGGAGLWTTEDARVPGHLRVLADFSWSVAGSPLVLEPGQQTDGGRLGLVDRLTTLQLAGAVELWRQLRLGLALPVMVPRGEGLAALGGSPLPSAAMGDIRLHSTFALWPGGQSPLALALALALSLPSGDDGSFAGTGTVGVAPRILITLQPLDVLTLRGQVGAALHARRELFGSVWGNRLVWSGCVELGLPRTLVARRLTLMLEADGSSCAGCDAPLELRGGLRLRWGRWHLSAGGGGAVMQAATAPGWRALGSLGLVL